MQVDFLVFRIVSKPLFLPFYIVLSQAVASSLWGEPQSATVIPTGRCHRNVTASFRADMGMFILHTSLTDMFLSGLQTGHELGQPLLDSRHVRSTGGKKKREAALMRLEEQAPREFCQGREIVFLLFARCKTESLYAFIRRGESVHGRLMTTIFVVTLGVVWLDPLHTLRLSICLLVTARIQDAQRHTEPYAITTQHVHCRR